MNTNSTFLRYATIVSFCFLGFSFTVLAQQPSQASYKTTYKAEKAGEFMKNWWIAGPFDVATQPGMPADSLQEAVFRQDLITGVIAVKNKIIPPVQFSGRQFNWQLITSPYDAVDLDSLYKQKDFAYAYAFAEIVAPAPVSVLLAVGSDDAIKVWHNGKLVHQNFLPRGLIKDNDLVPLKLEKGSNQLLLKVQDMERGWGFSARLLDKKSMTDQLN
ncbi:MAG: hypothetical protein EOO10_24615, partial [Chitinophagaceae bacterium]